MSWETARGSCYHTWNPYGGDTCSSSLSRKASESAEPHRRARLQRCLLKKLQEGTLQEGTQQLCTSLPSCDYLVVTVTGLGSSQLGYEMRISVHRPHSSFSFEISPPTLRAREWRWPCHRIERGWIPATAWKANACQLRKPVLNFIWARNKYLSYLSWALHIFRFLLL